MILHEIRTHFFVKIVVMIIGTVEM